MKITNMVYVVLIFGLALTLVIPMVLSNTAKKQTYNSENKKELAYAGETIEEKNTKEVAIVTPTEENVEKQTTDPIVVPEITAAKGEAVYDNLTLSELEAKLNRVLKSNLSGTGNIFVKYAMQYGVDPYLAVAITLHETGCNWQCSAQVTQCNNVGGMKGAGSCQGTSYASFPTLDEGIKAFIQNIKVNYYDFGLTTPELMNRKYAASTAWSGKINSYINQIKQS